MQFHHPSSPFNVAILAGRDTLIDLSGLLAVRVVHDEVSGWVLAGTYVAGTEREARQALAFFASQASGEKALLEISQAIANGKRVVDITSFTVAPASLPPSLPSPADNVPPSTP